MTGKERMHAVLEGRPVDRMPVAASYCQLYHQDHFDELTGLPRYRSWKWLYSPMPDFLGTFRRILHEAPFDIVQPPAVPSPRARERTEYVERDGTPWLHDRETGAWRELPTKTNAGHGSEDYHAQEEPLVSTREDVERLLPVVPAEELIAQGEADAYRAVVQAFPSEFVMTGGVVGTIYGCGQYLGQTNLFMKLIEEPELVEQVAERVTERNVQRIRALAAAGGDAIYVDDATATSEMISPDMYRRFSLPAMKRMVQEIHRHSHRAIIIYFGGVMDRLDELASIGADGLAVEASMKGSVNDIGAIARRIGDRVSLFANLNPYDHIQRLPEDRLLELMRRQAEAGSAARGFIMAGGSPITMGTRLERMRWFIDVGRRLEPARRLDQPSERSPP